jgi:hypothetical protein
MQAKNNHLLPNYWDIYHSKVAIVDQQAVDERF